MPVGESSHLAVSPPSDSTSPVALSIVLNAHLPYVLPYAHWPQGRQWLFRTVAETYLPILSALHRLVDEGVAPNLTLAFSPMLCEMLSDLEFATEFDKYLQERIATANANKREFAAQGLDFLSSNALFWESWYTGLDRDFEEQLDRDILGAFRSLYDGGHIEIIATAASQAVLSRLSTAASIAAQVRLGLDAHKKYFGRPAQGIWLPAPLNDGSAYTSALVEKLLEKHDLKYFVPAAPSVAGDDGSRFYAEKLRLRGLQAPESTSTAFSHPAALRLHPDLSSRIWSQNSGFAGDDYFLNSYRQYYPGGLPYWRHTQPNANPAQTEPYEPQQVGQHCEQHAEAWLEQVKHSANGEPVAVALDAHALGYWWHEGHNWLRRVLRKTASHGITLQTASEVAQVQKQAAKTSTPAQPISPLWAHPDNAWVWPEIQKCEEKMIVLARNYQEAFNPKVREILDQCAREIVLMQDATWPLLMAGSEQSSLAAQRVASHIEVFECLSAIAEIVAGGEFMSEGSRAFLAAVQERDRCFPNISYSLWAEEI